MQFGAREENIIDPAPSVIITAPITNTTRSRVHYGEERFPKTIVYLVSFIQLIIGLIVFFVQFFEFAGTGCFSIACVGGGFWCGLFFAVSGLLGIRAAFKASYCTIITFMVFSIISACLACTLLSISSIAMSSYTAMKNSAVWITYAIQAILSVMQVVVAITSSALACRAMADNSCCACCTKS